MMMVVIYEGIYKCHFYAAVKVSSNIQKGKSEYDVLMRLTPHKNTVRCFDGQKKEKNGIEYFFLGLEHYMCDLKLFIGIYSNTVKADSECVTRICASAQL